MTDRIFVSNLCLHGFHGVHKWVIVEEVTVTVRKPSAPIRHLVDHVGVSITRSRNG